MAASLRFKYDPEADIFYVDTCKPYAAQESEELGDDTVARLNPTTGAIENLEVLFFSKRILRGQGLQLPVAADLRVSTKPRSK